MVGLFISFISSKTQRKLHAGLRQGSSSTDPKLRNFFKLRPNGPAQRSILEQDWFSILVFCIAAPQVMGLFSFLDAPSQVSVIPLIIPSIWEFAFLLI